MIDNFTKKEFEKALPQNYIENGLVKGEFVYDIPLDGGTAVRIRSSVKPDGVNAPTGDDSIRCWLVDGSGRSLAVKIGMWTNRVKGWDTRMNEKIQHIAIWRKRAGDCPSCNDPMSIRKSSTAKNPNRPFSKCFKCQKWGSWLDGDFTTKETEWYDAIINGGNKVESGAPKPSFLSKEEPAAKKTATSTLDNLFGESADLGAAAGKPEVVRPKKKVRTAKKIVPNEQQTKIIDAPVGQSIRCLAPPGSGKTATMVKRYKSLVDNGVNPDRILAVTFSKNMADELLAKILADLPDIAGLMAEKQISTIHAFCYRTLKAYGEKRNPGKEWQEKKILKEIIEELWDDPENRPGHDEVRHAIDLAKYHGKTSAEDRELYYVLTLDSEYHTEKMNQARSMFDRKLRQNKMITFSDMVFDIEQRLMNDKKFREEIQSKYDHIIVDEAQDTSGQALRVLITVSLPVGENMVYEQFKRGK